MDNVTKEKRSRIMSRIRCKNTRPELALMAVFDELGVKYKYQPKIAGRPDFLVGGTAVFVDGVFWHCKMGIRKFAKLPFFWKRKLLKNRIRDIRTNFRLRRLGYSVVRVSERDLLLQYGR